MNRIVKQACRILVHADCQTIAEFWRRMGRPDLESVAVKDLPAPYVEALHLAQRNVPPSRNPRNQEFAKQRRLRAEAAKEALEAPPKVRPKRTRKPPRGERRNIRFGRKPRGNTTPLERRAIYRMQDGAKRAVAA